MMSQSLATYTLVQCVASAAQFASGEVAFYESYAELMASDAEGGCTSPLRIDYDVLEHFRIVRAQQAMRLTLPRAVVHQWAELNGFASQLDLNEEMMRGLDGRRGGAGGGPPPPPATAVLLLQLTSDDLGKFLQTIAPLVAASRRSRSLSRISVTEPLPLYAALLDPAPDVAPDSRANSCASTITQSGGSQITNDENCHEAHDCSPTLRARSWSDRGTSKNRKALPSGDLALLGADDESTRSDHASRNSPNGGDTRDCTKPVPNLQTPTRLTALAPSKSPPRAQALPNTLESVEDELAGLLQDSEYPQLHSAAVGRRGHAAFQPLKRPCSTLPATIFPADPTQIRGTGCSKEKFAVATRGTNACVSGKAAAVPSLCPSLTSSAPDSRHKARPEHDDSPEAEKTKETKRTRVNRRITAHVCASERGPSAPSPGMAARGEFAGETVATVTCQSDRIQNVHAESRLSSHDGVSTTDLHAQSAHPPEPSAGARQAIAQGAATPAGDATNMRNSSMYCREANRVSRTSDGKGVSLVQVRERPGKVVAGSPAPSSVSMRLGDLLASDGAGLDEQKAPTAKSKSTAIELAANTHAQPDTDIPTATAAHQLRVHFDGSAAASSDRRVPRPAPLLNAEAGRDAKSYLLNLFAPTAVAAPRTSRQASKKAKATAARAPPTASRRRTRPPKAQSKEVASQAMLRQQKKMADAVNGKLLQKISTVVEAGTSASLAAVAKSVGLQSKIAMETPTKAIRKRSRSASCAADLSAAKRPSAHRSAAAVCIDTEAEEEEPRAPSRDDRAAHASRQPSPSVCNEETRGVLVRQSRAQETVAPMDEHIHSGGAIVSEILDAGVGGGEAEAAACSLGPAKGREASAAAVPRSYPAAAKSSAPTIPPRASLSPVPVQQAQQQEQQPQRQQGQSPSHPEGFSADKAMTKQSASFMEGRADMSFAQRGDMDSNSSMTTCPLFYRRDSRKERTRRFLRYMNLVSQSLATLHETHDEMRGLLLAMVNENQL